MAFRIQEEPKEVLNIGLNHYHEGNYILAKMSFELAAEQGSSEAQFMLGNLYENGKGIPKDYKKAAKYYELAASRGNANAQFNLGSLYKDGLGVQKDTKKNIEYYRLAAAQKHAAALFSLGFLYENSSDPKDLIKAAEYYQLAASQGHAGAQFNLGILYSEGQGVSKDMKKAVECYQLAADQKDADAQYILGTLYETGQCIPKDLKKAVEYYQLAVDQGHANAQVNLGVKYKKGQGTGQDYKKAVECFQLAAFQGNATAQFNLGISYRYGQGVLKDLKKAAEYYKLAANQGDIEALNTLGDLYARGQDVPKDGKKAAEYYKLAAKQGYPEAQYNLGIMYQNGYGVPVNNKRAMDYLELAAKKGSIMALHNLSVRYRIGRDVKKDEAKAAYHHQLATTVKENDEFRRFISNKNIQSKRMKAPSLLVKIFKKTPQGVNEKGLHEYIFSRNVDLSQSFIPWNLPFVDQRGPTCALSTLKAALEERYPDCDIPPVRKNPIKPTSAEKDKNKHVVSLRKMAKQDGSIMGEIFNIYRLESLAKRLKFNECKVIKMKKEKRGQYIKHLLKAIREGHNVVVPVDNDDGFPGNMNGQKTHYALAVGYIYNKNENKYYFIVSHWGRYYLWDTESLQKSHEQLPDQNPLSGEYYKDCENDTYFKKDNLILKDSESVPTEDKSSKDKPPIQKKYIIPPSRLDGGFKFAALLIPASKTNPNILELKPEETKKEEGLNTAVKSSDAITLKLLAESSANSNIFPSSKDKETLQKIAEENEDRFSLMVLKHMPIKSLPISEEKPADEGDQTPKKQAVSEVEPIQKEVILPEFRKLAV